MSGDQTSDSVIDTSAVKDAPVIKQGIALNDAVSGDQVDLTAIQSGVAELASEALSAFGNPASWLVNKGLGFLMDFIKPIEEAIQMVSGDKESLTQSSKDFAAVNQDLESLAAKLVDTVESGLTDWNGDAADTARGKITEFGEGVQNTAKQAYNLSEILKASSTLAEAAEGAIRGILSELITWMIMTWVPALASAGPTFGSSTAAAGAATSVQVTIATSNTAAKVNRVVRILNEVLNALTAVKAALDTYRAMDAFSDITSGNGGDANSAKQPSDELKASQNIVKTAKAHGENHPDYVDPAVYTNRDGGTTIEHNQTSYNAAMKTLGQYGNAADKAANDLEKQAEQGGFSDVPSNKTIEGQLDF